jgi:hypothetical protein
MALLRFNNYVEVITKSLRLNSYELWLASNEHCVLMTGCNAARVSVRIVLFLQGLIVGLFQFTFYFPCQAIAHILVISYMHEIQQPCSIRLRFLVGYWKG